MILTKIIASFHAMSIKGPRHEEFTVLTLFGLVGGGGGSESARADFEC